jgi:hypothetical protein
MTTSGFNSLAPIVVANLPGDITSRRLILTALLSEAPARPPTRTAGLVADIRTLLDLLCRHELLQRELPLQFNQEEAQEA